MYELYISHICFNKLIDKTKKKCIMPLIQIHHRLQGEEQMLEIFLLFNLYLKCIMKIKSHILPLIVLDISKEVASQVNKFFAFGKVTAARLLFNQIWCESSEKPVGNMDGTIKQSSNGCQHPSGLFTGPSRSLTVSNATMTEKTTLNRKKRKQKTRKLKYQQMFRRHKV